MAELEQTPVIDRGEAIRRVTVLLGAVALSGGSVHLRAGQNAQPLAATSQAGAVTFTATDIALLDEVAETILPETKTPGAKAAHVGAFMALMVTDTYEDRDQQIFRDGMKQLKDASFMAATPDQRLGLLERIDREQKAYGELPRDDTPPAAPHYFRQNEASFNCFMP